MGRPEAYVERYLKEQARRHGALLYKFTSGEAGVPDRILIAHGHTVFIECKRPGGRPRPLQVVHLRAIAAHGGDARVIDTREGVDALMEEVDSWQTSTATP